MSPGLDALRDDRVDPAALENSRFGHGRGTRYEENAGGLERLHDVRIWQPEMKADHFGLGFEQQGDVLLPNLADRASRVRDPRQSVGIVMRLEILPHGLSGFRRALRIGPDRIVDIEGAGALLAK